MPILQVLLISILGALMATDYINLLPADARKALNKVYTLTCFCFPLLVDFLLFHKKRSKVV